MTAAKIFICYKANVEPDESLAQQVSEALRKHGHTVFTNSPLRVGQEWAREIERYIRNSDFLVVFLTQASSRSEIVKAEIEIARDQAAKTFNKPKILTIRAAFTGALPYPLSAWLDRIRYVLWRGESDTTNLLAELIKVVSGKISDLAPTSAAELDTSKLPSQNPPIYSTIPSPPGGSLGIDDPTYISRQSDVIARNLISHQGITLTIKGTRQMGKTSLLMRTLMHAVELGKEAVVIDFQLLGNESIQKSELFFRYFMATIAAQLEMEDEIRNFWEIDLSITQNCTRYMERRILQRKNLPTVIAIDEVDRLFVSDFQSDFFGMLRAWHNSRANPLTKIWKKLDLILVTSTEPYLFIERAHESPFNVGELIQLQDFGFEQIHEFNRLQGSPFTGRELKSLYEMIGGQPYLIRKAFYSRASGMSPEELFATAKDDAGPFGDHMRQYFLRLVQQPELADAFKRILKGKKGQDVRLVYRLQASGLIKIERGNPMPRCTLYAEYFGERL